MTQIRMMVTEKKPIAKTRKRRGLEVTQIDAGFPNILLPIFTTPCPIKAILGGRASGKSTAVARTLLLYGKQWPLRILCCREFARSSDASMHQILEDEIYALGLQDFYEITKESIVGKVIDPRLYPGSPVRQTEFIFKGVANNPQSLKSMQLISLCWIEEAQNLTERAWIDLEPTVRHDFPDGRAPEIFLTWNPQYADDFVYETFVLRPQEDSMVIKCNYFDNPWCPKSSLRLANRMKQIDHQKYEHVWLGKPLNNIVGSVYEDYLGDAYAQNRIRSGVDYDPNYSVELFFDLGHSDMTSVWAAQRCDNEIRIIDYYEARRKAASHFIEIMKHRGYPISKWVLPHDGRQHSGPIPDSWEDVFRKAGLSVRVLKYKSLMDGINAAREQFHKMVFDADRCSVGLNCLRHYRFSEHKDGEKISSKPVHDIFSNGADAFRYMAMGFKHREVKPFPKYSDSFGFGYGDNDAWMSL